ncbi:copper amine oxidase N-terminal domain-containing protein [Heliorestis convoluta]|uniref:Copper amine oxidase N-terminal domain-containing protein n=1 Tax=Heliorestis convoluta TaxID=356322 RepID=A0A5Q2N7M6_9FIRM|nr:copper amine oxidase N-terminal domain-containing protein [Heliorestis convoluta]QGG49422.1 copper amine oxidase N-terminal domain-containing protein [Heliorestis convoluta]
MKHALKITCTLLFSGLCVTALAIGEAEAKNDRPGQPGNMGQAVRAAVHESLRERNIPAGPKNNAVQVRTVAAEKVEATEEEMTLQGFAVELAEEDVEIINEEELAEEIEEAINEEIVEEQPEQVEEEVIEEDKQQGPLSKQELKKLKKELQLQRKLERKQNQALAKAQKEEMKNRAVQDRLFVHGQRLTYDVPPVIREGRVLVPVRAITEGMGAQVDWNQESKLITITRDGVTVELSLDSSVIRVNGVEQVMDTAPSLYNNRTLVPLRFISIALGDRVLYDEETGEIDIIEEELAEEIEEEIADEIVEEEIVEDAIEEEIVEEVTEEDIIVDEEAKEEDLLEEELLEEDTDEKDLIEDEASEDVTEDEEENLEEEI